MPEITEKQTPAHKPQRKKNKETHNAVERHRKKKINAGINRIGELLPCSPALKQSKNMILDQALRYIAQLKQQNDALLLNGGDRVQAEEIRRLRRQLEELRRESAHYMELLKANGISFLDDPTVHWKGKLRCAKVAKVTPTHLVPDGIIVYSNGNVVCPVDEEQANPRPALLKQPTEAGAGPKLCPNRVVLQDPPPSSPAQVLVGSGLAPPVCLPSVRVMEQPAKVQAVAKLPPSVSYITLQGLCPLPSDNTTVPPPVSGPTQGLLGTASWPALPAPPPTQAASVTPKPPAGISSTVNLPPGTSVPPSRASAVPPIRISTAGSTQTTWTTLQLGGNSQPVCHPAPTPTPTPTPTPDMGSTSVSVYAQPGASAVAKPSAQPFAAPPHVQTEPAATPTATPQSAVLPVLQVLQVRSNPAPQTASNPNVFILQPAAGAASNSLPSHNPCQHIVIIQAANQSSTPPNCPGSVGPAVVSAASQIGTSSVAAAVGGGSAQTVGGKQLVHILPRPLASSQTSQTVTVSGQVFALQAVKPPGRAPTQPALQIIQPTAGEDPNITLQSLGALASLNQSISHIPEQSPAPPTAAAPPVTVETVSSCPPTGPARSAPLALALKGGTVPAVPRKPCVPLASRTKRTGTKKPITVASSQSANLQDSRPASLPSTVAPAPPPVVTTLSHITECSRLPPLQQDPALSMLSSALPQSAPGAKPSETAMERDSGVVELGGNALQRKDPPSSPQECVLDQEALEQPLVSSSCAGSRGFSIASMLPMGHGANTSASALGTFSFTSEQAEILALAARAFFEQDAPAGGRGGSCSTDAPSPAGWDIPKPQQSSTHKDRGTGPQAKHADSPAGAKLHHPVSLTEQPGDGVSSGSSGSNGSRNLSLSYSTSPHSQAPSSQSQPTQPTPSQSSAAGSLSVNNLIRPLSSGQQQPYACSPGLTQQGSAPSPIAATVPVAQSPAPLLPPCPEYAPLKNALLRPQGVERHLKDIPKRPAPEDALLPSAKRPKICSAPSMVRMDMKAAPTDHSQMMVSSGDGSSTGGHATAGLGGLFPGNSFMSSVLRPAEGHCVPQGPPQGPPQEQGHPQHTSHASGHHVPMGNPYLKQQQQQGQRHHHYQLQHHLTQSDQAQFHGIHQRALQQDQHSQKKRGLVRGGQPGAPMGLPQKQHHEKSCEAQPVGPRAHHSGHLGQERQAGQNHGALQRLMSSRTLEQQLTSQPGGAVSRPSDITCTPSRQERHRISSYSAEALIGKSSSSADQRMGLAPQATRPPQDQPDMRTYLEVSRGKGSIGHNPQSHPGPGNILRGPAGQHPLGGFEVQASRGSDMTPKPTPPSHRGLQTQGFRMGPGSGAERQPRGVFPGTQGVTMGAGPREQESCHQSFMQSLLVPHLPEQVSHQRMPQCCPPLMEYSCTSGGSGAELQAKAGSPSVPSQKTNSMRIGEGNKGHLNPQVSSNMQGPVVRAGLPPHPTTPQSSTEPGRTPAPTRPINSVSQRARHLAQDVQGAKMRPGERVRSGTLRSGNPFEPDAHLPLPTGGGVLLGRQQASGEARRGTIVRFMPDVPQVGSENLVSDQHLAQNFSFPFIPEGGMNPPPINASPSFIPPVTQPSASRTSAILPVEPQNTLPSFYPSYSPAAHPSLPSDIPLQYFSNQMFTSPSADKSSTAPLNNRFGSILSPTRPVGFTQASFPLLPEMPPMPIANSSGITPHLSNFNLTSLFPEIGTAMPPDGTAMPMSPLLSLTNTSSADSSKQPNRPAHNISHILGHDGSSAV
ncbi:hypothetical protein AGOR_G00141530 [Albula goreensis]|uniref:BHLH domain-containing protein n=1 Tax=Albula goreensis TaxID=1534307 RepID=A0A8T3D0R3_9TELE|nr:hypothetical protein AGOR_G00141530 [Albula goreensis]